MVLFVMSVPIASTFIFLSDLVLMSVFYNSRSVGRKQSSKADMGSL